jgi:hypothetical protein
LIIADSRVKTKICYLEDFLNLRKKQQFSEFGVIELTRESEVTERLTKIRFAGTRNRISGLYS